MAPVCDAPKEESTEAFDDGFESPVSSQPCRLYRQPVPRLLPPGLTVLQDAVSEEAALAAYHFTCREGGRRWGTYFTLEGEGSADAGELPLRQRGVEPEVESMAKQLLADFWRSGAGELMQPDLAHVHGFSVWAVVGGVGMETKYHVDYAEIYRRRTNCVVPPLHSITIQVSPVQSEQVEGGTFGAHIEGLAHYSKHGYKCRRRPTEPGTDAPTDDWEKDPGWQYAPYKFRQATLSSGELMHATQRADSTPTLPPRVRAPNPTPPHNQVSFLTHAAQCVGGPRAIGAWSSGSIHLAEWRARRRRGLLSIPRSSIAR